uniref:Ubiquitin-like protease family profile domain-containing protein n=2 Tax=Lactuca sativa TaxID=4236 RepID=A0A9R1XMA0_LACSA|nr:hypothetical protein LSAT_V11C300147910 [Lactuca sativa]
MEDYVNNPANMHDFSLMNTKVFANLKGSGGNIWEVFEVLDDVRRAIFRNTVFGYFIDVPRLQGDALLFHKMFLHQIRPNPVLSPDGIKRLYFRVGNTKMVYGPEEFCLITGFNFGDFAWGSYLWDFTYVDLEDTWNKIHHYLSLPERGQTLKYSVSGFTAPIREGLPPRQNMLSGDGKAVPSPVRDHFRRQDESSSSMSSSGRSHGRGRGSGKHKLDELLKRVNALEQHVFMNQQKPTKVFFEEVNNEQFWNDIIFEELTVSQRNYDEQVVQDEVMNKNNTTQNVFGDTQDDKVLEESTQYAGNKFDDDVCDVNDYSEVKEEWEERNDNAGNKFDDDVPDEDELIIMGNVDYFHDDDDDKEVTPDKPRSRKPSQFLCTPYTELHTTPKQKRRTKKKVGMKSTSPVPPPVFGVAHDFSRLRLQPYVAGGEDVIQNYVLHSYDVQHRLFNFVLDRDFWSSLFGHTHDGWLESAHITIWYRLLMERRFESDRHTIMPPNFFVSHALEEGQDWRAFMAGIATYPNFMVAWWDVDTVLLPIHSSPNHWLFGELRLASMEVHIYDSLGRGAYEKFQSEGIFSKFERRVANYLDKIKYWGRRNIPRIPLNMQFIYEENVPQQSSHLGDCGVFLCMFMEQLVSGQPIRVLIDPKNAALEFRLRMAKIIWGSSLAPL